MTTIIDDRFGHFEMIVFINGIALGRKLEGMSDEDTMTELEKAFGPGEYKEGINNSFSYIAREE